MDYNIAKTVQRQFDYTHYKDGTSGGMPSSMLMSKFEETNIPHEGLYYDYSRELLADRTPDKTFFEYEEARGPANQQYGRLQLQYYGHRGYVDTPYRAEYFDGFAGPEYHEPRGINVDPDFTKLRDQNESRSRFQNFVSDGSANITGGGLNERQVIEVKQDTRKRYGQSLKVFDRQLDGRRNGLNSTFDNKSQVPLSVTTNSYGDLIRDQNMKPQNRANIICDSIRNSVTWRSITNDCEKPVANYRCINKQSCKINKSRHFANLDSHDDKGYVDLNQNMKYYLAAKLMGDIIKINKHIVVDVDEDTRETVARKTEQLNNDLTLILKNVKLDSQLGHDLNTIHLKTQDNKIKQIGSLSIGDSDQVYASNAQLIYTNVKQNNDLSKISKFIITDLSDSTKSSQIRKELEKTNTRLIHEKSIDDHEKNDMPSETYDYKNLHINVKTDPLNIDVNRVDKFTESDSTIFGSQISPTRLNNWQSTDEINYLDNTYKDKKIGTLGSKYMKKYIDNDFVHNEFSI